MFSALCDYKKIKRCALQVYIQICNVYILSRIPVPTSCSITCVVSVRVAVDSSGPADEPKIICILTSRLRSPIFLEKCKHKIKIARKLLTNATIRLNFKFKRVAVLLLILDSNLSVAALIPNVYKSIMFILLYTISCYCSSMH